MKKYWILVLIVVGVGMNVCTAQEIKFLSGNYIVTPSNLVEMGQPIAADIHLVASEYQPDLARLNLSIGIDEPIVKVDFDGQSKTFIQEKEIEFDIPPNVKTINISLKGNAPSVEKLTPINVAVVRVYVEYGERKEYQDVLSVPLKVTTTLISQALAEINSGEQEFNQAKQLVDYLKEKGIEVSSLEKKLSNARELLDTARELHDRGEADLALQNAEAAIEILDDVIKEANNLKKKHEQKEKTKKIIPAGIVILAILILLLRKKRQELG